MNKLQRFSYSCTELAKVFPEAKGKSAHPVISRFALTAEVAKHLNLAHKIIATSYSGQKRS